MENNDNQGALHPDTAEYWRAKLKDAPRKAGKFQFQDEWSSWHNMDKEKAEELGVAVLSRMAEVELKQSRTRR